MSTIIIFNSVRRSGELAREKEKIEYLESFLEGEKIPDFLLVNYKEELSSSLKDLVKELKSIFKEKDFGEKKLIVKNKILKLTEEYNAQQLFEREGDRGRNKNLSRAPREIPGKDVSLKLLSMKDSERLYEILQYDAPPLENTIQDAIGLPTTLQEAQDYIKSVNTLFQSNRAYAYGVKDVFGKIVGEISLTLVPGYDKKIYEIGFWISKPYLNKGYITEAGELLKTLVFTKQYSGLGSDFLIINTQKTNEAANAVAKKLGFILEPHQLNYENDKVTWSKNNQGNLSKFFNGQKYIADLKKGV